MPYSVVTAQQACSTEMVKSTIYLVSYVLQKRHLKVRYPGELGSAKMTLRPCSHCVRFAYRILAKRSSGSALRLYDTYRFTSDLGL